MARLMVQAVAKQRGVNMSQLLAMVNTRLKREKPVAVGTIRRYWYATKDGNAGGEEIEQVDLVVLGTIARALGVRLCELMNEEELGQKIAA